MHGNTTRQLFFYVLGQVSDLPSPGVGEGVGAELGSAVGSVRRVRSGAIFAVRVSPHIQTDVRGVALIY